MQNMRIEEFYQKVKLAIEELGLSDPYTFWPSGHFLTYLNKIMSDSKIDNNLKMTRMSVLFEGFYRSLDEGKSLKKRLTDIRLERWGSHYGTPTITFLLTHNVQIEKTRYIFG